MWRFFKENIAPKQVKEHCSILCFSAKWVDNDEIFYADTFKSSEKVMLRKLNKLLDAADAVVGHNLSRFDTPKIRGRSLVFGLPLPSPYKEIDTYLVARKEFGFDSNSLDYLSRVLKCGVKSTHKEFPGFELWVECLKKNPKAWAEMKKYNIQDIIVTEAVYKKMLPYFRNHPNWSIYVEGDRPICSKCGSDVKKDGFYRTNLGKYQQYQCKSCGGWVRGRTNLYDKEKRKSLLTNAV